MDVVKFLFKIEMRQNQPTSFILTEKGMQTFVFKKNLEKCFLNFKFVINGSLQRPRYKLAFTQLSLTVNEVQKPLREYVYQCPEIQNFPLDFSLHGCSSQNRNIARFFKY